MHEPAPREGARGEVGGHHRIAYNSCRNRHCPKCQGAAAREWFTAREADLLPLGYFHVVFTVPAEVADIAFHNKAVVYDLLFRAACGPTDQRPADVAGLKFVPRPTSL